MRKSSRLKPLPHGLFTREAGSPGPANLASRTSLWFGDGPLRYNPAIKQSHRSWP